MIYFKVRLFSCIVGSLVYVGVYVRVCLCVYIYSFVCLAIRVCVVVSF